MSHWKQDLLSGRNKEDIIRNLERKEAKGEILSSTWKQVLHSHDRESPGKFDAKSDEEIFLGYSTNSQAYRVYNKHTKTVMESINVVIDDTISEKDIDNDGEGQILKKNEDDDNMSHGEDDEKESPGEEFISPTPRRVTRSTLGPPSPLTPPEVQPPISCDVEPSNSKRPLSRVILNHPSSNVIG